MKNFDDGVTILELIVACAVTVIVGLSVFGAVYSGRTSWQAGGALVDSHMNAANALDVMQREISSMFIFPPGGALDDTGLYYGIDSNGRREFRFYALITRHSGAWDLCRVGYRYDEEKREIQRLFNVDIHEGKQMFWQPMAGNVNSLEFYLYSGGGDEYFVYDHWDTFSEDERQRGRLPDTVRIVIKTQDGKRLFGEREFEIRVPVPARGMRVFIPGGENHEE